MKWEACHSNFRIALPTDWGAVTADNVHYFRTKRDVNSFYTAIRLVLSRCVNYLSIRRMGLMKSAWGLWREEVLKYAEASKRDGNWEANAVDVIEGEIEPTALWTTKKGRGRQPTVYLSAIDIHGSIRNALRTGQNLKEAVSLYNVSMRDDRHDNIASLPLALSRDVDKSIPPTVPREGINLPPLALIPAELGEDGSFKVDREVRPKYNSYRARMQGPTDDSCWIIPSKLAMGRIPLGPGWTKKRLSSKVPHTHLTDCLSLLLLSGVGTFISLMTEEEEKEVEAQYGVTSSINSILQNAGVIARSALKAAIFQLKAKRDTLVAIMESKPRVEKFEEHYAAAQKERLKLKSSIQITQKTMDAASADLEGMAENLYWERLPLRRRVPPTKQELMPILWEIEDRLARGEVVYVYGHEGHGRVGLVCGCLLGRLYGLSPAETLFRLEVHHDCYPRRTAAAVDPDSPPVSCLQNRLQQQVLVQVLKDSNRVYEQSILRSQPDPETFTKSLIASNTSELSYSAAKTMLTDESGARCTSSPGKEFIRLKRSLYSLNDPSPLAASLPSPPDHRGRSETEAKVYSKGARKDPERDMWTVPVLRVTDIESPTLPQLRVANISKAGKG